MKSHACANRAFRIIWSEVAGAWIAVSELTRGRGKSSRAGAAAALTLCMTALTAHAGPSGGQVSAGNATIVRSGATTTVNQSSQNLSLNWASFNIGAQETVNFMQPNAASIAINRIADTNGSQILGHLNANGQVFLINPNGILFGAGSQVNVGGMVASTLDLNDAALNSATRSFSGSGSGAVVNQGTIHAAPSGYVALLGNQVSNQGLIQAQMGSVALGAGSAVTLNFGGAGRLQMQVDKSTLNNLAQNSQLIQADGGTVLMTAGAKDSVLASVVNNSGVIEARGVTNQGGTIVLTGGNDAGRVTLGGTLDVSATAGVGGVVSATAHQVELVGNALVNANGSSGGGVINIGSAWGGGGAIAPAMTVAMAAGATLQASATQAGNGGQITVRSDIHDPAGSTLAYGKLFAQGGPEGGSGGQIETSGYYLDVNGLGVSASAVKGNAGLWYLDPNNIDIVASGSGSLTTAGGTASYTSGSTSTISASSIVNALQAGNNVTITNSGAMGDITVDSPIVKAGGASDVTLTLQAVNTIIVNQPIGFTSGGGNTGKLNVNLSADTDHDGAGIVILNNSIATGGGNLSFGTGASATIGGVANTLVGGDVFVGGAAAVNLATTGGSVAFNGQVIIANANGLNIDTITGSATGGNVTFSGLLDSGNTYSLSGTSLNWVTALGQAKSGTGGNVGDTYLGTINSRLENAVASYTAQYNPAWLGAQRVIGIGSDGTWRWVAGPDGLMNGGLGLPFYSQSSGTAINGAYINWNSGEPNNYNGSGLSTPPTTGGSGENAMQFVGTGGQWNDLNPYVQYLPSIVERNLAPSSLTINAGTGTNAGNVTFAGAIGGVKVLNNFAVTGNVINLNANPVINTAGSQTYTGQVTAGGVDKNIVSVAAPNTTLSYGSAAPTYTTSCSGADCVDLTSAGTVTISQAVGAVGLYGLTASGATSSNPNDLIVYNAGSLLVNPLAITVAGTAVATRGYDGTTTASLSGGSLAGALSGDLANLSLGQAGAFAAPNAGVNVPVNVADTLSGSAAGNYALVQPTNVTGTITQAPLSVAGSTSAIGRPYNGSTAATLVGGTLSGTVYGSDAPTLVQGGTYASKNVGTAIPVTPGDTLTGTGSGNYELTQPTGSYSATITAAPVAVTAVAASKTYDGTVNATGTTPSIAALAGAAAGDVVNSAGTEVFGDKNAGSGKTLTASGVVIFDALGNNVTSDYAINYVAAHNGSIAQAPLTVTATSVSKTYDGTLGTNGAAPSLGTLAGAAAGDTTGNGGTETYADKNAGNAKTVNASGVTIRDASSVDVTSNYAITYVADTASSIARAPLSVTATPVSKTYDGGIGTNGATPIVGTLAGASAGESVNSAGAEAFGDKNVGTGKSVSAAGATIRDAGGADVTANYAISYQPSSGGTINRLGSVAWIGGATGNWFDPANWAGGAVPDLSNVANVVIPAGVIVSFSATVVAPAQAGPVNLNSLGDGGSLAMSAGTLNVGSGGVALAGLSLTDGSLASQGPVALGSLNQSGGTLSTSGNFSTTSQFMQTGSGTLAIGGSASVAATSGDVLLGNVSSAGALTVADTGGSIGQAAGTVLSTGGASSFSATNGATAANVVLTNAGDSFGGPVSVSATNASIAVAGPLTLGTVDTTGNLTLTSGGALDLGTSSVGGNLLASSGNGNVTQEGALTVGGTTGVNAGSGNIALTNAGNTLAQALSISGQNASVTTAGPLTLGTVDTTGNLTLISSGALDLGTSSVGGNLLASSANGNVTQDGTLAVGGTTGVSAGSGNITLTNAANTLAQALSLTGQNAAVTTAGPLNLGTVAMTGNLTLTSGGALDLGTSSVGGNLLASSGNGNVTQDGALAVGGTTGVNAGSGNIALTNAGNTLAQALSLTGQNAAVTTAGPLNLGTVATTGSLTLTSGGALDLGTSSVGGNLLATSANGNVTQDGTLAVGGTTGVNAGSGNISLTNAGNTLAQALSISGQNASVTTAGPLTLGTVDTTGNLTLISSGALDLGTSSVGGNLLASSGNGNVTQDAALAVVGSTRIDAGTGSLTLHASGNQLSGTSVFHGSTISINGSGPGVPALETGAPVLAAIAADSAMAVATAQDGTIVAVPGTTPTPAVAAPARASNAATASDPSVAPNPSPEQVTQRAVGASVDFRVLNGGVRLPATTP